jgi:hypothetical protein
MMDNHRYFDILFELRDCFLHIGENPCKMRDDDLDKLNGCLPDILFRHGIFDGFSQSFFPLQESLITV